MLQNRKENARMFTTEIEKFRRLITAVFHFGRQIFERFKSMFNEIVGVGRFGRNRRFFRPTRVQRRRAD
uniref:Uncharacterized protein n=1 Tax=Romanomermis culicivorax TaxID=13658 RepID=A0A915HQQ7_ROMCU